MYVCQHVNCYKYSDLAHVVRVQNPGLQDFRE